VEKSTTRGHLNRAGVPGYPKRDVPGAADALGPHFAISRRRWRRWSTSIRASSASSSRTRAQGHRRLHAAGPRRERPSHLRPTSNRIGRVFHHASFEVGNVDEIGMGRRAGCSTKATRDGWGIRQARHRLEFLPLHPRSVGTASPSISATSTTSRRIRAGRRPTTRRKTPSTSGAPSPRESLRDEFRSGLEPSPARYARPPSPACGEEEG